MEILFLLIPLSIIIAFIIAGLFFWSVKSGQFDDMSGPAYSILMDDDSPGQKVSPDLKPDENEDAKVSTGGDANG